jgi:hypothetical protein
MCARSSQLDNHYFIGAIVLGLIVAGIALLARQWSKPFTLSVLLMPFHPWQVMSMRGGPMARNIPMPHPGLILKEELIDPLGMSAVRLPKKSASGGGRTDRWFANIQAKYDDCTSTERVAEELAAAT